MRRDSQPADVRLDALFAKGETARALAYIQRLERLNPNVCKVILKHLDKLPLGTQVARDETVKTMLRQVHGTFAGWESKAFPGQEKPRKKHSFGKHREFQLLRQISTQLFLGLNAQLDSTKDREAFIEVQTVHADVGGKSNLFVAANRFEALDRILRRGLPNISALLRTVHTQHVDTEGRRRSERYAEKLTYRLFGKKLCMPKSEDLRDELEAGRMAKILKAAKVKILMLDYSKPTEMRDEMDRALRDESAIYIIHAMNHPAKGRHAEGFLSDITRYAKARFPTKKVRTVVGGKKRPCGPCAAQMADAGVDDYNKHPSRVWVNSVKHMTASEVRKMIRSMLTKPGCITQLDDGKLERGYGSASDSESEMEIARRKERKKKFMSAANRNRLQAAREARASGAASGARPKVV